MFYFDNCLKQYEKNFEWDRALRYLENLYSKNKRVDVLNSLIGFSWYYFIEGPCITGKKLKEDNSDSFRYWKKYINIGLNDFSENDFVNFIIGYSLSLHGFYISDKYETLGINLIKKCFCITKNIYLKVLTESFLHNFNKRLTNKQSLSLQSLNKIFPRDSLLEEYFKEIFK